MRRNNISYKISVYDLKYIQTIICKHKKFVAGNAAQYEE